jgi:hypothetical protein
MTEKDDRISDKVSYRDSRRAAFRILQPGKTHAVRRFLSFVIVGALVLFVWNTLTASFPPEQRALLTVLLSNVMSNTATVSVVLPVAVALLPGRELEMCLILGLSASCALLLPVSTPPNAVAFSTGELEARDLRPGGLLIGLLGPALIIAWVLFISGLLS